MPDLSKEIRRFPPGEPGSDPVHIGIVYPNTYQVAVSSLGYQTVHLVAHSHPGVVTHRIVLENTSGKTYPSRTLEERLEIRSLAALLVSCSFELDYLHLVRILHSAGIPTLRNKRGSLPLIIVGGIAPTANPEPLALVADAIAVGDAEKMLPGLLDDLLEAYPLLQGSRFAEGRDQLHELWDRREGVYVPALWEAGDGEFSDRHGKTLAQVSVDNPDEYPSFTPIISPEGVYGSKNLVEISSGCPAGCRFCLLSYVLPARRERSKANILENARRFRPDEASIGLISSRVSDHPDIVEIIDTLADDGYQVSVSSLRMPTTTRRMLDSLARAGSRTVTLAPEHGSESIRKLVCKPLTYDEIRDKVAWAFDAGMSGVKLYFLTGFHEESDVEVDETGALIQSLIQDIGLSNRPADNRLSIGIAPFVPKPTTPFQRRAMQDERTLKRKLKRITGPLGTLPRVDVETESPRLSIIQGALSISDRSVGLHLDYVSRTLGSIFASWDEALREVGDSPRMRVLEERPIGTSLPWSFIRRPKP